MMFVQEQSHKRFCAARTRINGYMQIGLHTPPLLLHPSLVLLLLLPLVVIFAVRVEHSTFVGRSEIEVDPASAAKSIARSPAAAPLWHSMS